MESLTRTITTRTASFYTDTSLIAARVRRMRRSSTYPKKGERRNWETGDAPISALPRSVSLSIYITLPRFYNKEQQRMRAREMRKMRVVKMALSVKLRSGRLMGPGSRRSHHDG